MSLRQYFVDNGYAVFEPNVRGSSGYGKRYMNLDNVRNRMDSVKDGKAGVDWLGARDDVDDDRIVAYGGSYGGFMVLASLTEYPETFAAGVDIVGIANFVTFLENTGDWRREHREAEYGSLAEDREFLESISPTNNAEKIRSPLLVLHGANDPGCRSARPNRSPSRRANTSPSRNSSSRTRGTASPNWRTGSRPTRRSSSSSASTSELPRPSRLSATVPYEWVCTRPPSSRSPGAYAVSWLVATAAVRTGNTPTAAATRLRRLNRLLQALVGIGGVVLATASPLDDVVAAAIPGPLTLGLLAGLASTVVVGGVLPTLAVHLGSRPAWASVADQSPTTPPQSGGISPSRGCSRCPRSSSSRRGWSPRRASLGSRTSAAPRSPSSPDSRSRPQPSARCANSRRANAPSCRTARAACASASS